MRANAIHFDRSRAPEGFLTAAEHLIPEYVHQERYPHHRNGATGLHSILLVVADGELGAYRDRYATVLARPATTEGQRQVFQLWVGRVEIVPASAMDTVLPGETAPVLPFIAAITVADLNAARTLIQDNGIAVPESPDGFLVRAEDAGGAGVVFRQE